jgi:hypothetical protein
MFRFAPRAFQKWLAIRCTAALGVPVLPDVKTAVPGNG